MAINSSWGRSDSGVRFDLIPASVHCGVGQLQGEGLNGAMTVPVVEALRDETSRPMPQPFVVPANDATSLVRPCSKP